VNKKKLVPLLAKHPKCPESGVFVCVCMCLYVFVFVNALHCIVCVDHGIAGRRPTDGRRGLWLRMVFWPSVLGQIEWAGMVGGGNKSVESAISGRSVHLNALFCALFWDQRLGYWRPTTRLSGLWFRDVFWTYVSGRVEWAVMAGGGNKSVKSAISGVCIHTLCVFPLNTM
jgi:hypothetical protein